LIVDESHSFGIIGPTGRGAVEQYGLPRQRVVAGGSMAKAFCAYGGVAVGPKRAIEAMWKSPAARGAASGMSCGAAMTAASMRYVEQHPEQLKKLRENTGRLKAGIRTMGIEIEDSDAPVVTFAKGSAAEMIRLQQQLFDEGILVFYSTYVGAGPNGVIRCAVFADHTPEDIDRLLATFSRNLLSIHS
jgi:7-keto-8-aminopelargonate synthetase-like enzyme